MRSFQTFVLFKFSLADTLSILLKYPTTRVLVGEVPSSCDITGKFGGGDVVYRVCGSVTSG